MYHNVCADAVPELLCLWGCLVLAESHKVHNLADEENGHNRESDAPEANQ